MLIHHVFVSWHCFYWCYAFRAARLLFTHCDLLLLLVFVCQAVIVRNRLKHIQPDRVWFIFEVSRFKLDRIQGVNRTAGSCQLRSKAQLPTHISWFASLMTTAVHVLFCLIDLCYELVETLLGLFVAYFTQLFALLFRHSNLHFCEGSLLGDFAIEDLLFSVHIVITVKVYRLGPRRCIDYLLLHSFQIKLGLFLLCKLVAAMELLTGSDYACFWVLLLFSGCFAGFATVSTITLWLFLWRCIVRNVTINKIGDDYGACCE